MIDWHRLFGLTLMDLFTDSPYVVELEKDLSFKQQRLDVVIIEQGEGDFQGELPDGLENLGPHNLLTFVGRGSQWHIPGKTFIEIRQKRR